MAETTGDAAPAPDLAVVLVHGIGEQPQGEFLTQWGDALSTWIDDYGAAASWPATQRLERTYLKPGSGQFATSKLSRIGPSARSVQLIEAWWADGFQEDTFADIVRWSVRVFPTVLIAHVAARLAYNLRRFKDPNQRRSGAVVATAAWLLIGLPAMIVLAPVLIAAMLALVVLGAVPISITRDAVRKIQLQISSTLGDSRTLLDSPIRAASMTQTVVDAIQLARNLGATRVAVVAHSQGAAITKWALEYGPDDLRINRLITVGAGIAKLEQLDQRVRANWWMPLAAVGLVGASGGLAWRAVSRDDKRLKDLAIAVIIFVALAALISAGAWLIALVSARRSTDPSEAKSAKAPRLATAALVLLMIGFMIAADNLFDPEMWPVILGVFALMFLTISMTSIEVGVDTNVLAQKTEDGWLDLWARNDPVSNGPMRATSPAHVDSVRVRNMDSAFRDHSSYHLARDGALARVASELLSAVDVSDDFCPGLDEVLIQRGRRVEWLRIARWASMLAGVAFLVVNWNRVDLEAVQRYDDLLGRGQSIIPDWLPDHLHPVLAYPVAVLVTVIGVAVVQAVMTMIWRGWDTATRSHAFAQMAGTSDDTGTNDVIVWQQLALVFLSVWTWVVATLGWRWLQGNGGLTWENTVKGMAAGASAAFGALVLGTVAWVVGRFRRRRKGKLRR